MTVLRQMTYHQTAAGARGGCLPRYVWLMWTWAIFSFCVPTWLSILPCVILWSAYLHMIFPHDHPLAHVRIVGNSFLMYSRRLTCDYLDLFSLQALSHPKYLENLNEVFRWWILNNPIIMGWLLLKRVVLYSENTKKWYIYIYIILICIYTHMTSVYSAGS